MPSLFKKDKIEVLNTILLNNWPNIDAQQMEQVFINLLTNCIYALNDKEQKKVFISAEAKENRTFITISNNGKGIDPEIENKIFLPFFTTRKEGAGIGLTLSNNIVEWHGGYLAYYNEVNKTSFVFFLI
ncbi:sensor histidine kinase [Flavobacterium frigidarium]|uniref:sensor histidine kinase n=1 Tax=Flavobacterium frigidarium TaxID=99286 RepID=UPI0003FEAF1E|nr:ATP-binding protein [Flavobacterium frigidarium]